jgi:hypothetical protein
MSDAPPPPPPPPPPTVHRTSNHAVQPPSVGSGSPSSFLVELLLYNGAPFMDHWAYFVRSHAHPSVGVVIEASGDVLNGFSFDIGRSHDLRIPGNSPTTRTPLQWVDKRYFGDENSMLNNGIHTVDHAPACPFESTLYKIKVPEKSLNAVSSNSVRSERSVGKKIVHRNCQTWIVESAEQLVEERIFSKEVAAYLHAIKQ